MRDSHAECVEATRRTGRQYAMNLLSELRRIMKSQISGPRSSRFPPKSERLAFRRNSLSGMSGVLFSLVASFVFPCVGHAQVMRLDTNYVTFATRTSPYLISQAAVQPDGKVLVSGYFDTVNGKPHKRLVRLLADGSLDSTFIPSVEGSPTALADGKILVHQGTTIRRLNPDGSLDGGYAFSTGLFINRIVPLQDGRVYVCGSYLFGDLGIARLSEDGEIERTFDPQIALGADITTAAVQSDGKVLVAGRFPSISGMFLQKLARLNIDGTVDESFDAGVGPVHDSPPVINALAVKPNGHILVGGQFTSFSGIQRSGVAELEPSGAVAAEGNSGVGVSGVGAQPALVSVTAVFQDGSALIGGNFDQVNGVPTKDLVKLNPDGSLGNFVPPDFADNLVNIVRQIAIGDDRIWIAGTFTQIQDALAPGIGRLHLDGRIDLDFNPRFGEKVTPAIALQPDRKILLAGGFDEVNGTKRTGLARLDGNGILENAFQATVTGGQGVVLAVQSNGGIILGGNFTDVNGQPRRGLARVTSQGSLDLGFNPIVAGNAFPLIRKIAIQADGRIVVGGGFTSINGSQPYLARLNSDGSLDSSFSPPMTALVRGLAVDPQERVVYWENSVSATMIRRININGTVDASYEPGRFIRYFHADDWRGGGIVFQPDGKALVFGNISLSANSQPAYSLIRFTPEGVPDESFRFVESSLRVLIEDVKVQQNGKILVARSANGRTASALLGLNADGSLDPGFNPGGLIGGSVTSIEIDNDDGGIVFGGRQLSSDGMSIGSAGRMKRVSNAFLKPTQLSGAGLDLLLMGETGRIYRIDASANLRDWLTLGTVSLTNSTQPFVDASAPNFDRRFYRAVLTP